MNVYRVIDSNINRVSEGIRVLEDISRFIAEDINATKKLRELRHSVRKSFTSPELLKYRNSREDIGLNISRGSLLDKKESIEELVKSNFKRAEEGLRCIEECLKTLGFYRESKIYENLRFNIYSIEKYFNISKACLNTDIYGILCEKISFGYGRNNFETAKEMTEAGIKIIQYREKDKTKRQKYEECLIIREITKCGGALFIVNDDVDIALATGADGVHIGQDDMPLKEARRILGNMIIGVSTHNEDQAKVAVLEGADYIGVGPMFSTTTKKDLEPSEGLKFLKWVSENILIPYVAIGGITEDNISDAKYHGGRCFAMISELAGAKHINKKVESIRNKLHGS